MTAKPINATQLLTNKTNLLKASATRPTIKTSLNKWITTYTNSTYAGTMHMK